MWLAYSANFTNITEAIDAEHRPPNPPSSRYGMTFTIGGENDFLEWSGDGEVVRVEAWGANSLRVRAGRDAVSDDMPHALLVPEPIDAEITLSHDNASISSGTLVAVIDQHGVISFQNSNGRPLIRVA